MARPASSVNGPSSSPWPSTACSMASADSAMAGDLSIDFIMGAGAAAPVAHARRGRSTTSGTWISMSRLASSPRLAADSPFPVTPLASTSERRSAVSGARWPPALKKSRCPQLPVPSWSRPLSTIDIEVPWRVTRMERTAGWPAVDW